MIKANVLFRPETMNLQNKVLKRKHHDPIKGKMGEEKMEGLPLFPEPD